MSQTINWKKSDGSSAVELAGSTDLVADLRLGGQQVVQQAAGMRAASVRPINRRNMVLRYAFVVTHAPAATAVAAKQAIATRTAALAAATADRTLLVGVFGALTWQLADAALEDFEFEQLGLTVRARYSFLGSAFTDATPPP